MTFSKKLSGSKGKRVSKALSMATGSAMAAFDGILNIRSSVDNRSKASSPDLIGSAVKQSPNDGRRYSKDSFTKIMSSSGSNVFKKVAEQVKSQISEKKASPNRRVSKLKGSCIDLLEEAAWMRQPEQIAEWNVK